jgi:FKBP-type peptidyl-prolyl cis-trans isomerase
MDPAAEAAKQAEAAAKEAATKAADDAVAAAKKAAADAAAAAGNVQKAAEGAAAAAAGSPDAAAAAAPAGIPVPSELPVVKKTELEGGLILEDLKIGEGYEVKEGGAVVAYYHGTLKEGGKVFDSAFDRGEPAAFPLTGVIPGWQKGVPGMKLGGIRRLIIPAALGYGERGAGQDIPPNSDLVFIIQLVDAVQMTDEKVGDGEEALAQAVYLTAYTLTDKDGKVIESATKDKPYMWIPNEHFGIQMGLTGMKVGGKRKVVIPSQFNQSNPQLPGGATRPANVPITAEIELLGVKNLMPARR